MGINVEAGAPTIPYMKFNVMYPDLLGRVSFWLGFAYGVAARLVLMCRNATQWALEMKVLSSLPDRNLWQGSVAVFIDSGSSSVSLRGGLGELEMPVC